MSEVDEILAMRGLETQGDKIVEMKKPEVELLGQDGNAFYILGACKKAARKAGWDEEKIARVMTEMKDGDYNHLLRVAMTYFEVL